MLRQIAILLICLTALPCGADEPSIRWPMKSNPAPVSNAVDTLKVDSWLVVESSGELFVRRYPEDKIAVVEATTRGGDRLYLLRGVSPGIVCIDLIPVGLTTEKSIARHVVTVTDGTQPNPPPPPKPEPGPGPQPVPPKPNPAPKPDPPKPIPVVEHVALAIVEDTMQRSPELAITLNSLVGWNEFADGGNVWRIYDRTTREPKGKQALAVLGGTCPGIVISDRATGSVLGYGPMPTTFDELKAMIRRLKGG